MTIDDFQPNDWAIAMGVHARSIVERWWERHSEDASELPAAAQRIMADLSKFVEHAKWLNQVDAEKKRLAAQNCMLSYTGDRT